MENSRPARDGPTRATLAAVLKALAPWRPTVVGTYPLGLQHAGSDLDVLCEARDLVAFEHKLRVRLAALGAVPEIWSPRTTPPSVAARLTLGGLTVEVFGQRLPVYAQRAYRHMIVEGRLLAVGGAALAEVVIDLMRTGLKTEPAFAEALGLLGDPYEALLEVEAWSLPEIEARLSDRGLLD